MNEPSDMSYDFSSLSWLDFEDLARDLIGQEEGIRFEAFGPGADGGMDGRHARGNFTTILQAKHYGGSAFANLLATMKRERASIDRLQAGRYLLATSQHLTEINKRKLQSAIGPTLKDQADIFSRADLNGLLRKYPEIEKAHIKLWLSSSAVLERIMRGCAYGFATLTREEISAKVRIYVQNPSLKAARDKLEAQHLLIVSGPPGVGKTTLAQMLAYAYVGEGWKLKPIRTLEDGFAAIVDQEKQVFFFDDFLGKVALDKAALSQKDSDLARFMRRVRDSKNSRFILTTRAYIFEEARRISENLADDRLNISKYVLHVGIYTRRIKARILYNHLHVFNASNAHVKALIESGKIPEIVDHPNYNPRIIEWMTDATHVGIVTPGDYAKAFVNALANPKRLWDIAFRTHIPDKCRHLLFSLFFCSEYGEKSVDLKPIFETLHASLCRKYGHSRDPKDFEEALRILEGGFITIANGMVSYVNPSVRDYLGDYLDDLALLEEFARSAQQAQWARNLWRHGVQRVGKAHQVQFAYAFGELAKKLPLIPLWKASQYDWGFHDPCDLPHTSRIEFLIELWKASSNVEFARIAADMAAKPAGGFNAWRDGRNLIDLILRFKDGQIPDFSFSKEMIDALEDGLIKLLDSGLASDDLETISDAIEDGRELMIDDVIEAAARAIKYEFDNIDENLSETESYSTLEDQKATLAKLAPRAGIDAPRLVSAIEAVDRRIIAIEAQREENEAEAPTVEEPERLESDKFDDEALVSLFKSLIQVAQILKGEPGK